MLTQCATHHPVPSGVQAFAWPKNGVAGRCDPERSHSPVFIQEAGRQGSLMPAGTFSSRCFNAILRSILRVFFRVRMSGDASAFANERTLIVANHESFLDGLLLAAFLPVSATFVVHTQVLDNVIFRFLLRFVPHLAVDSTSPLAIKVICRLVETGRPVVIFPEGRLTVTGSLMKVYDGAAFVAARTRATVVPVRIEGSGRSYFGRLAGLYPRRLFRRFALPSSPRGRS